MAANQESLTLPQRLLRHRKLRSLVIFAAIPYAAIVVLLTIFQRSLIYAPAHDLTLNLSLPNIPGAASNAVDVEATDKLVLHGWHITSRPAGGEAFDESVRKRLQGRPVILYFCGNAGNRAYRAAEFELFAELGADAICFDYRGFGDNAGQPSEAAFAEDARTIWRFVTEELHITHKRIIIFGESLGGGTATRLAAELSAAGTPPGGLILRSTFTRLTDVAAWHLPWLPVRWMLRDRYPSADRIGQVTCPIMIVHGHRDTIVPFEEGEQLFAAAPMQSANGAPKHFVDLLHAHHNDVLDADRGLLRESMREFVASVSTLD